MTETDIVLALRAERLNQGITIRDIAQRAGLKPSTIWRIESGNSRCQLATIIAYAKVLGLRLSLS